MPALNEVQKLFVIVGDWVCHWILNCHASIKNPLAATVFRNYLNTYMNTNVKQELLSKQLNIHLYDLSVSSKCNLIELLGDNNTASVDLSNAGELFVDEVFALYRVLTVYRLTRMIKLGFSCTVPFSELKYVAEINPSIYNAIKQMSNLRWVTLMSVGDTEMLQILGETCTHLEFLEVKNSHLVTDASVAALLTKNHLDLANVTLSEISDYPWDKNPCCSQLYYLGISGTFVTTASALLSILLVPQLASFGGCIHKGSLGKAILLLKRSAGTVPSLCLTHISETLLSHEEASAVVSACPEVKFLSTICSSLPYLRYFNRLQSLTIDCDFKDIATVLLDLLAYVGQTLSSLHLKESVNSKIDLHYLIECAPDLTELEAPLEWIEYPDVPILKFTKLDCAVVTVASSLCLKNFLLRVPEITDLKIRFHNEPYSETHISIDDSFLIDVLAEGALQRLKYFMVNECGIGDAGLDALLESCPSLCHIEKLFYWENVSKTYLRELQTKRVKCNWNLRFVIKERYCDMSL